MKVALLYPPPWKIPRAGQANDPSDGPPEDFSPGDLDPDFHQTPYGLFSLGAQAKSKGHQVKVLNLSGFTWNETESVVRDLAADVYGMSCWTANRRGVALVAREIKRLQPNAHVVIGGPHATPFAKEMLEHYPDLDTVCVGESELSFLEILERLERGQSTAGIAGTFYREQGQVNKGPARGAIEELDTLVSPHRYYSTHIVMTSRGCPWQCTFCGAETTWGRGFRGQSVDYVLDSLELALSRASVKMLQIKDDTFTANKKRALAICQGIRERKLNFLWSCDTRVDVLSDELLHAMRLAGCQRLSLGVESGSATILKLINKKITVDKIIQAADMAKRHGIAVRFYMMLGNRGETRETFEETLRFLERAKPHQYIFSCLSIYPGTQDFDDAEKAGWLDRELYFRERFQEYKVPFDASAEDTALLNDWFAHNKGVRECYQPSIAECQATLELLGDYHAAHLDLAGAYYRAGSYALAKSHAERALELSYPAPGLVYNYLACIAFHNRDLKAMQDLFMQAAKTDPQHAVLIQNVQAARAWFAAAGDTKGLPLELVARHDFQLFERNVQPALPGPLPQDFAEWEANAARGEQASVAAAEPSTGRVKAAVAPSPRHLKLVQ